MSSLSPNCFYSESNRIPARSSRGASDSDRQQWPRESGPGRLARSGPSRALKDNRIRVGPARHRRLGKRAHGPKDSEAWGVESGLEHPWH